MLMLALGLFIGANFGLLIGGILASGRERPIAAPRLQLRTQVK